MKLKLNRTLRAALIAAITVVGFTLSQAQADQVTYTDMLKGDTYTWTKGNGTIDSSAGSFTCNGWNDGWADHTFANALTLTAPTDVLNFSYDITIGDNAFVTLTLVSGNGCTITTGWGGANDWSRVGYGTSTSTATNALYQFKDGSAATQVQVTEIDHFTANSARPYNSTVEGSIAWSNESNSYVLTLNNTPSGGSTETKTLDLGKQKLTFTDIIVGVEGKPSQTYNISNVSLSATYTVPTITSLVWKGKEGSSNWSDSVWGETGDQPFASGTDAVFDNTATSKTVGVTEDVSAGKVTVSDAYAFNLTGGNLSADALTIEEGGSLAITGSHAMDVTGAVSAAGTLSVGEGATLKVGSKQKELMMGTAVDNKGTFLLTSNVSLANNESTQMGGTLGIQGATVTLGTGEGTTASIASFSQVNLDGGTITVNAQAATIKGVTVAANKNGTIKVEDMQNLPNTVLLAGNTQVAGTLNLTNHWNSAFAIERLSGAGTLNQSNDGAAQEMVLTINSLEGFTGTLSLKHNQNKDAININTGTAAVNFNTLELAIGGHTANFTLGANTEIGLAKLTGGTLALSGADTHTLTLGGLEGGGTITGLNDLTLNVTAGSHEYTGTYTMTGQITKTGAGSQTIATGTALYHTIQVEGGTLTLKGSYEIKNIAEGTHQTVYVDDTEQVSENGGFQKNDGKLTVYSVNTAAGGNLVATDAVFTYNGVNVTDAVVNGEYTLPSTPDMTTLYVKKGTLAFAAYKAKAGATLTTVSLADGTTVDMNEAATINLVMESAATGTVNATAATTISGVTGLEAAEKLIIKGSETVTLGAALGSGKVEVDGGTLALGNAAHLLNSLTVKNGGTAITTHDGSNGAVLGTIEISNGGTFRVASGHDAFGWGGDTSTQKIILAGTEQTKAVLDLQGDNKTTTMVSAIEMNGHAAIQHKAEKAAFNTFGCSITANSTDNTIDRMQLRNNVTVTVNADSTLEIGQMTRHSEGSKVFTKAGDGALTVTGEAHMNGFVQQGGSTIFEGVLEIVDDATINAGTVNIGGAATIGNLGGTGALVVKDGGSIDVTGKVTNTNIMVEDGGTIAGGVDATAAKIAAEGTATFTQGIENGGVTFGWEEGSTKVTNKGETAAVYGGIADETMRVTTDLLTAASESAVTVKNEVVVSDIANLSTGTLTLTHVALEPLEGVYARDGALTLQNITEVSLVEMEIASGSTVAVYKGDVANATQEGTVTITEKLHAGGGTLLANLEMANGSKLAVNGGGENALTLGSQFTIAKGALVRLDEATLEAIAGLENIGDTVILINEYAGSNLTTNLTDGDWARTHFDLSSITDAEFKMYVTDSAIGIVKSSMVPEPTTGTLSLLALAALCARRRK